MITIAVACNVHDFCDISARLCSMMVIVATAMAMATTTMLMTKQWIDFSGHRSPPPLLTAQGEDHDHTSILSVAQLLPNYSSKDYRLVILTRIHQFNSAFRLRIRECSFWFDPPFDEILR